MLQVDLSKLSRYTNARIQQTNRATDEGGNDAAGEAKGKELFECLEVPRQRQALLPADDERGGMQPTATSLNL